jgi:hypothetical protein
LSSDDITCATHAADAEAQDDYRCSDAIVGRRMDNT